MSGTRVMTTRLPLMAPEQEPEQEDADDDDDPELLGLVLHEDGGDDAREGHHRAPIDRSIPPEMTTIAWATAASASGRTEMARPWMPETP